MRRTLSSGVLALVAAVVAGAYAIQGGAVDAVAASAASPGRGAPGFRTAPAPIVAASPDLVIDKTPQSDMGGPAPVAGTRFSYLIWYFNQSQTETANGVVVTETLPVGAALSRCRPSAQRCKRQYGGLFRWRAAPVERRLHHGRRHDCAERCYRLSTGQRGQHRQPDGGRGPLQQCLHQHGSDSGPRGGLFRVSPDGTPAACR